MYTWESHIHKKIRDPKYMKDLGTESYVDVRISKPIESFNEFI